LKKRLKIILGFKDGEYLRDKIYTNKVGLNKQKYNIKTLISAAYSTGRILVISSLFLFGYHNDNNEFSADLSKCYDFENFIVKGET